MKNKLKRRYGLGQLHFITCSCYRRLPLFSSVRARNVFLMILNEVRERYDFALIGFVVMPEHIHLLMGEPNMADPSRVMQVLKQRVSRKLRGRRRKKTASGQMGLWEVREEKRLPRFWQRRFYDFNVWSKKKRNEKLNYMHFNPVKRGLVGHPKEWEWSSYRFYWKGEKGLCPPNPGWQPRAAAMEKNQKGAHPCGTRKNAAPTSFTSRDN